ncbi:MAG: cell division ATP-binding protein FtsE [Candidatus Paraimprobicoccus trichonymphae]|uniref:Cell division ATP-binding protein FtsE n=1 Tax=Candidatus Paraimprobicoccus trichonymphae TaxID=3033793 RepID=A0AA48HZW7_9FIRM|nr:MAG: cell division ATP-binding protein FtsE [Candidatus Paraimprobicoccus trichonymphae]
MIKFENVTKLYNNSVLALDNLDINIHKNEFVFIVGSSGSGKSTFLKLTTKEEEPTSGNIFVNGRNITKMKYREVPYLRRKMGIVFQDFRLIDKMSVFENVAFGMNIIGASTKNINKRVPYILNLVGLKEKAKRRPNELSGGEKQRIGLARALVNNPSIIIADEPTGNIDPVMSFEIINLLSKINKFGTTIIVVTHDLSIVRQFPFRIIEISKGKVVNDNLNRSEFSWL